MEGIQSRLRGLGKKVARSSSALVDLIVAPDEELPQTVPSSPGTGIVNMHDWREGQRVTSSHGFSKVVDDPEDSMLHESDIQKRSVFHYHSPSTLRQPLPTASKPLYPLGRIQDSSPEQLQNVHLPRAFRILIKYVILGLTSLLASVWIVQSLLAHDALPFSPEAALGIFKLHDALAIFDPRRKLTKAPLLFVRNSAEATIVWETNSRGNMAVNYYAYNCILQGTLKSAEASIISESRFGRHLYAAHVSGLMPGCEYMYEIKRVSRNRRTALSILNRPWAAYAFHWTQSTFKEPVSPEEQVLHMGVVGDNQFNARVFHSVLVQMEREGRRQQPKYTSGPEPHFLLHLGDLVQSYGNHKQWQTDFWDPLTWFLPRRIGPTTPMLAARGNHDYDPSGNNTYLGGIPPVTSFSPHERVQILVLDSQVSQQDLELQEAWINLRVATSEWQRASIRIAVIHIPPFLEYWDQEAWDAGESEWGSFVRTRLLPMLEDAGVTAIISGHQHAYSRGFLPESYGIKFSKFSNSTQIPESLTAQLAQAQPQHFHVATLGDFKQAENGIVLLVAGGAGGDLDTNRVESWPFMEVSVPGKHFFSWLKFSFGLAEGTSVSQACPNVDSKSVHYNAHGTCQGTPLYDVVQWFTKDLSGNLLDNVCVVSRVCAASEAQ